MTKKKTGWPFLEGFIDDGKQEIHLFTDYRWNDGSISRRWHIDPKHYDRDQIVVRSITLEVSVLGSAGQ